MPGLCEEANVGSAEHGNDNTWNWSDPARARSVNDYYGIAIKKRAALERAFLPDLETRGSPAKSLPVAATCSASRLVRQVRYPIMMITAAELEEIIARTLEHLSIWMGTVA